MALTSDVRVAGLLIVSQHSEDIAISVVLRYHHRNGSGIEYGALSAEPGRAQIWAPYSERHPPAVITPPPSPRGCVR